MTNSMMYVKKAKSNNDRLRVLVSHLEQIIQPYCSLAGGDGFSFVGHSGLAWPGLLQRERVPVLAARKLTCIPIKSLTNGCHLAKARRELLLILVAPHLVLYGV